jgi:Ca2+-binding EF-hand superfamily protein
MAARPRKASIFLSPAARAEERAAAGEEVERMFTKHDVDKSGDLDLGELGRLMQEMNKGEPVAEEDVQFVVGRADKEGNGVIDLEETKAAMRIWKVCVRDLAKLNDMFKGFQPTGARDFGKTGKVGLGLEDLRTMLVKASGENPSLKALEKIMTAADKDGNGVIDMVEARIAVKVWYATCDLKQGKKHGCFGCLFGGGRGSAKKRVVPIGRVKTGELPAGRAAGDPAYQAGDQEKAAVLAQGSS